jgi:ABC-type Mn2+/Zn2+ transport system permease subunit
MKIFSHLIFKIYKFLKNNHLFLTKSDYYIILVIFIQNCFFLIWLTNTFTLLTTKN